MDDPVIWKTLKNEFLNTSTFFYGLKCYKEILASLQNRGSSSSLCDKVLLEKYYSYKLKRRVQQSFSLRLWGSRRFLPKRVSPMKRFAQTYRMFRGFCSTRKWLVYPSAFISRYKVRDMRVGLATNITLSHLKMFPELPSILPKYLGFTS